MAQIVPIRVNDTWVNVSGKLDSPRYVFIVDRLGKDILSNPSAARIDERDQVVEIAKGKFEIVNSFLKLKHREYKSVSAIVLLWFGADELCKEAPFAETEMLPEGPFIVPHKSVSAVVDEYSETLSLALALFPQTAIFSSDPAPRRSKGFAITHANHVAKLVKEMSSRHHHFLVNSRFHGRRASKKCDEPGGKFPIHDNLFIDGVIPKIETWATVVDRTYAAITAKLAHSSLTREMFDSLKLVKFMF